jgi:hypothetical protein
MSGDTGDVEFETLGDFYRFYLGEHRNGVCRALPFIGSTLGLSLLIYGVATQVLWLAAIAVVPGYACAWIGHFGFEKNRPATFKHPLRSFICDWIMWKDILTMRIPLLGELPQEHYAPIS